MILYTLRYDAMVNNNRLIINTKLPGFVLIDKITEATAEYINGTKNFSNVPVYLGIESLAQLGAYHIRFITRFERHAFLLKITSCLMPATNIIDGRYLLYGTLLSRSESAFTCRLRAKKENETSIEGEFLYATVDYNHNFKKEKLQNHYREVFLCLQNDIKID